MKRQKQPTKQLNLFTKLPSAKAAALGGSKMKSHAKRARPLAPKARYHIMFKSEKAKGALSLLRSANRNAVREIAYRQAKKFFVRIEQYANVGNHLHFKVYAQAEPEFRNFLRSVTAMIARHVTGARRGKKFGRFWSSLAFTRLIRSWTELQILTRYIFANRLESACGPIARKEYLTIWYG
jgi:REP element-mobilizing transposase RayT